MTIWTGTQIITVPKHLKTIDYFSYNGLTKTGRKSAKVFEGKADSMISEIKINKMKAMITEKRKAMVEKELP